VRRGNLYVHFRGFKPVSVSCSPERIGQNLRFIDVEDELCPAVQVDVPAG
jgi:hypothetical protein